MRRAILPATALATFLLAIGLRAAQERPNEGLLRELALGYTSTLEDYSNAYQTFWSGLSKGPDQDDLWGMGTRYLALGYMFDQNETGSSRFYDLQGQFRKLAAGMNDRNAAILVKAEPNLVKYETRLRARLAVAAAAASEFVKKRADDLKATAIDVKKLSSLAAQSVELCQARADLFQAFRSGRKLTIIAGEPWPATDIKVKDGETVHVIAYGMTQGNTGPDGMDRPGRFAPDAKEGALIARIEGMERGFPSVGSRGSFVADRSGYVMFRPNYEEMWYGAIVAYVVIEKRKKSTEED